VHYYYYGLYIPSCKAGLSFSYHMEIRLVRLLSYHLIFSVSKNWAGLVVFLYYFHGTLSKRAGGTPVAPLAGWLAKLCQKKNGGKDNKGGDAPKEARAHLSPGLLARRTIRRCRACLQENNQIKGWSWLQRPKPKKEATRRAVSPPPPHHPCMPCTASNAVAAIALSLSLRYSMR
jgi:hypothetical protein